MAIDGKPCEATSDVVVIGAGVNGCGVARDLALRGLSVTLFERNDIAFGASGNSSGMIHGGPRYMTKSPKVTEESCRDSGYIQAIAPHLLFRIPFIYPVKDGAQGRILFELIDAYFRAYDDYQPLKRGEPHTRLNRDELAALEPGIVGQMVGAITFDEWGVDGSRLCTANAVDAKEHGARIYVHTTVTDIAKAPPDGGSPRYVVSAVHRTTGERRRVRCRAVVNATGAWGPITAALGHVANSRVRVRPGKGIHIVFDRRLSNYAITSKTIDGREIFIEPWENMSVLGTTDDDYYADLDDVRATSEEVRYLIQGLARVFPAVRQARAIGTYAGVRPTLYAYGPHEDALSREHTIVDHASDGAENVYSMIGGKLASYRLFAEEMSQKLARALAPGSVCTTHRTPLPGGERMVDSLALASDHDMTPVAGRRLVYRHGARALPMVQRLKQNPELAEVVCPCEPVTALEIEHAVVEEFAETVTDVSRRTRLGLGACGGMRCAARCAQIVGRLRDRPPAEMSAQAATFLETQARSRIVAMGPDQARQEALLLADMRAQLGVPEGGAGGDR
jgi:glycerol-3-phosphate dehydrogenase